MVSISSIKQPQERENKMTTITTEEQMKIEMKVLNAKKLFDEKGYDYDNDTLQRIRNSSTQQIIHNKFCDENHTFNCVQHNPKNIEGIKDKSFALVDISCSRELLKALEDQVIVPLNRLYKDKGGLEDQYIDVGSIISHVLEKGIQEFFDDESADYFHEIEKEILEEFELEEVA